MKPSDSKCSAIAAGDNFSVFAIESKDSTDLLSCGFGQYGQLGHGGYNHLVYQPVKIKSISNLQEYDENLNKVVPIRVAGLFAGSAHAGVIFDNISPESAKDPDFHSGRDVYLWGHNAYGELNNGKKSNSPLPIAPDVSEFHLNSSFESINDKLRLPSNWGMELGHGITLLYTIADNI